MSKVSVIIPVYNTEEYLRKCLDSVCNQTLSDIEIICINDGSTDNSLDVLEEYAQKYKQIKIINFEYNKGAAIARNTGIDTAIGEYIGFVDSDDWIDLDFYEKLYNKAIETNSELSIGNIRYNNGNNIILFNKDVRSAINQNKVNFYCLYTTTIFKSEMIKQNKITFPSYKIAEDYLFSILSAYFCINYCMVDEVFYNYEKRELSATDRTNFLDLKYDYINAFIDIFEKIRNLNYQESDYVLIVEKLLKKVIDCVIEFRLSDDRIFVEQFSKLISQIKDMSKINMHLRKETSFIVESNTKELLIYRKKQELFNSIRGKKAKNDLIKSNLSEENTQKILSLKDKYKGKRCFIIGGSPSLNLLDLTKLNNEYTFTVNWGFKLREQGLNHSTFHVMTDEATFKEDNVADFLPDDFCDTYLIYSHIKFPKERLNTIFFDFDWRDEGNLKDFEPDATKPLAECRTIILLVMQLAYYMGFSNIYIIGVDLDFKKISGHAYSETKGESFRQKEFSVKYEQEMYVAIDKAAKIMHGLKCNVYNASPAGNLDCISRVKYDDLFKIEVNAK